MAPGPPKPLRTVSRESAGRPSKEHRDSSPKSPPKRQMSCIRIAFSAEDNFALRFFQHQSSGLFLLQDTVMEIDFLEEQNVTGTNLSLQDISRKHSDTGHHFWVPTRMSCMGIRFPTLPGTLMTPIGSETITQCPVPKCNTSAGPSG